MNEERGRETGHGSQQNDEQLRKRDADATSKETLDDVEDSEESSHSQAKDEPGKSDVPWPDGGHDKSRDQADDAGPM